MKIDTKLCEYLCRDGAILLPEAFSSELVSSLYRGISKDIELSSPFKAIINKGNGPGMTTNIWRSSEIQEFNSLCNSPEMIDLIRSLFDGKSFRFLQDTWFLRPAGCEVSIPWHHDNIIEGDHYSVWISLTHHSLGDSLSFVASSHWDGVNYMPQPYFSEKLEVRSDVEEYYRRYNHTPHCHLPAVFVPIPSDQELLTTRKILSWPTKPGDCIIFNSRCLHSLPSHDTSHERVGFVTRWILDGSRIASHAADTVKAIQDAGLGVDLSLQDVIRGELFRRYT
ncbi:MAG: phytanoyl-CoA dioxygenase family protein [Cyanobacteriota bacterium]|nr:phytanoyl-CoA dioxygenase family protein [Cyanobacteriota bacterium]